MLRHAKQFRATIVELDRRLADDPEQNAMTRADLHALISRKALIEPVNHVELTVRVKNLLGLEA